jgi:hypothetical protein
MKDYKKQYEDGIITTTDGKVPMRYEPPAPAPIDPATGQHLQYWVLTEAERKKGFVRPVRTTYIHEVCGQTTHMALAIAETYARDFTYYGRTFCTYCRAHLPVGETGEFVWADGSRVGT